MCIHVNNAFLSLNTLLACAFDTLTADLQIQQQLKPVESDINIDMDKLVE